LVFFVLGETSKKIIKRNLKNGFGVFLPNKEKIKKIITKKGEVFEVLEGSMGTFLGCLLKLMLNVV
jgi:hypothetical protein